MADIEHRPSCGGYKILSTLGKGGNAVVKLVEKDNQHYAMKIFEPHPKDKAKLVEITQKEVDVVQSIKLPQVAQYIEFQPDGVWKKRNGDNKNVCFLVMEIISGVELIDFFNQAKRQQEEKYLRYVFLQVADALSKLHAAGVAHRDIKPENIMLTESFEIKLIDLGYGVRLAGRKQDGFNTTKLGTEMYMAPEIVAGQPYQGADIDIFAFGVMMMVLRLMAYPFDNASMDDPEFKRIYEKPATFWSQHQRANVSEEFKSMCGLLLAPEPGARPTMADVLGHPWMRGEVADRDDFVAKFKPTMDQAVGTRDNSGEALDVDFQIATAGRRQHMRGADDAPLIDDDWAKGREFRPIVPTRMGQQCTQFAVMGEPLQTMNALRDLLMSYGKVTISKDGWKMTCIAKKQESKPSGESGDNEEESKEEAKETKQEESKDTDWDAPGPIAEIKAELYELEKGKKYQISLTRKQGEGLIFAETAAGIQGEFAKAIKGK